MPWHANIVAGMDGLVLDGAKSDNRNPRLDPHGTGN